MIVAEDQQQNKKRTKQAQAEVADAPGDDDSDEDEFEDFSDDDDDSDDDEDLKAGDNYKMSGEDPEAGSKPIGDDSLGFQGAPEESKMTDGGKHGTEDDSDDDDADSKESNENFIDGTVSLACFQFTHSVSIFKQLWKFRSFGQKM